MPRALHGITRVVGEVEVGGGGGGGKHVTSPGEEGYWRDILHPHLLTIFVVKCSFS